MCHHFRLQGVRSLGTYKGIGQVQLCVDPVTVSKHSSVLWYNYTTIVMQSHWYRHAVTRVTPCSHAGIAMQSRWYRNIVTRIALRARCLLSATSVTFLAAARDIMQHYRDVTHARTIEMHTFATHAHLKCNTITLLQHRITEMQSHCNTKQRGK